MSPPTWFLSFRDLTLYCKVFLKTDSVIEAEEPDRHHPRSAITDRIVPGKVHRLIARIPGLMRRR
jgi:hypothetical protein